MTDASQPWKVCTKAQWLKVRDTSRWTSSSKAPLMSSNMGEVGEPGVRMAVSPKPCRKLHATSCTLRQRIACEGSCSDL